MRTQKSSHKGANKKFLKRKETRVTNMTNNILKRDKLHQTYGGTITLFDFEGHSTMSIIAGKTAADMRFDRVCKKNVELRGLRNE